MIVTNDTGNIPLYLVASNNYPSIIWVTQDYRESVEVYERFSYDRKYTYTYPKKSHAVLLTGMDENYYYINDPLKNEKNIKVPMTDLEASFNNMGRQFISIN